MDIDSDILAVSLSVTFCWSDAMDANRDKVIIVHQTHQGGETLPWIDERTIAREGGGERRGVGGAPACDSSDAHSESLPPSQRAPPQAGMKSFPQLNLHGHREERVTKSKMLPERSRRKQPGKSPPERGI